MIIKKVLFKDIPQNELISFLEKHPKTQVVNADLVFGQKHVLHCVQQLLKAFAQGRNLSKSEEMEFLLVISGNKQINKAINLIRVENKAVFVSWSDAAERTYDEFRNAFSFEETKMDDFSDEEIKRAIEKSATFWIN